ncbi:MAG TPA: T9SS type A sorting domain-containing protein [Bacteroidales bacterium]|nr:T9SS type A sorting domain-containing protein [Bacteroidales bacterium]
MVNAIFPRIFTLDYLKKRKQVIKFILLLCLFLIFLSDATAQNGIETKNSFPGHWCCISGEYIYGTGNSKTCVLRKHFNGQEYETKGNVTTLNPEFEIQNRIYSTTVAGLIFVLVKDEANSHFLLRSNDGGLTFSNVFAFGENNGPDGKNAPEIRLLRGFLELTNELPGGGGKGTLFIGEYNIGSTRTAGSVNDRVRIMKSDDQGITWTKVVEWNTNGKNQVGHIHAMKQDPYTGEVYICTGDNNNKAGIIKWDGTSQWSDNRTLAEIGRMEGFEVLTGKQRYRVCDVLFDENYFYTFTDTQLPNNANGWESGIWRGGKDFSSFERMDNTIFSYDPMHVGWFGEKVGDTFIFTTAREYVDPLNAWKEINTLVYTSKDGIKWEISGIINWRDTGVEKKSAYITNMFTHNEKIYIDCMGGAGHNSTIVCEVLVRNPYDEPKVLHPVYFVGSWNSPGQDSNTGTNPDSPKATLRNILTSDNIGAGARVLLSDGNFNENEINPVVSGSFIQGRGNLIIEGRGMDKTHLVWSGNTSNYGIALNASRTLTGKNTAVIFKDIHMYISGNKNSDHSRIIIRNQDTFLRTISCKIGDDTNDDSPLIRLESEGAKYISENSIHTASRSNSAHNYILETDAPNTQVHLKNCIILNSWEAMRINSSGVSLSLNNCTFYNIGRAGIVIGENSNIQPDIKNCLFSCDQTSIEDFSGIEENSVDYNFYTKTPINVTDGGHSFGEGSDPMFMDPVNLNFTLKEGSPCIMKGITLAGIVYDFLHVKRNNPPSIGAFESCADTHLGEIPTFDEKSVFSDEVKVFPNPFSNTLFIDYPDNNFRFVRILNSSGIEISATIAITPLQQLNLSFLKPGIYFLELNGSGKYEKWIRIIRR